MLITRVHHAINTIKIVSADCVLTLELNVAQPAESPTTEDRRKVSLTCFEAQADPEGTRKRRGRVSVSLHESSVFFCSNKATFMISVSDVVLCSGHSRPMPVSKHA